MDSNNQEIQRRALEWIARKDSDTWTQADERALDEWRRRATGHNVAFIRFETVWSKASKLKVLGAGSPAEQLPAPEKFNLSPVFDEGKGKGDAHPSSVPDFAGKSSQSAALMLRNHPRKAWLSVAASLIAASVIATVTYSYTHGTTYTTPIGGLTAVPMEDGSRITLNTDSKIRVKLTAQERHVVLERGEAYFDVTHDPKRPFVVDVGPKRIIVLGTAFSVRRDRPKIQIVVTEGRVRLETADRQGGTKDETGAVGNAGPEVAEFKEPERGPVKPVEKSNRSISGPSASVELAAGEIAEAGTDGTVVQSKPLAVAQEALGWRSGLVIFHDVDLAHAVAELNRYNDRKIVIDDPTIAAMRFSGKVKPTYFDAFVRLLEDGFPIQSTEEGDRIVLSRRITP